MNGYLKEILANGEKLKDELPEGSFRRFFWQQQMQAVSCKDSRQIRWHPLMIKWHLNIKLRSTSAYTSERILRDYTVTQRKNIA
jgi:hypothetical protein